MFPDIVFEDDYLIAINKPYGIVVNNSDTQKDKITLQTLLLEKYPELYEGVPDADDGFLLRSGIVHRLDKDTSGVILIAKTKEAFNNLQKQFKNRKVNKVYWAAVYGLIKGLNDQNEIIVDAPLGRNPNNREKFAIVRDGKESETKIKLIDTGEYKDFKFSVVNCYPKTGRTHQIRVHLTALGTPVIGDLLYSGNKRGRIQAELFPRQLLHAEQIEFLHPETNEELSLKAPKPADIDSMINLLYGR